KWTAGAPISAVNNQSPIVNAGSDLSITLPASASLLGLVTDDGLPGPLAVTWTRTSGPGTVAFGNPNTASTTATFSTAGDDVLRLSASDGVLGAFDEAALHVNPAVPVNQPPTVDAGADRTVTLPASVALTGAVTDDGLSGQDIVVSWSLVSGPALATFGDI